MHPHQYYPPRGQRASRGGRDGAAMGRGLSRNRSLVLNPENGGYTPPVVPAPPPAYPQQLGPGSSSGSMARYGGRSGVGRGGPPGYRGPPPSFAGRYRGGWQGRGRGGVVGGRNMVLVNNQQPPRAFGYPPPSYLSSQQSFGITITSLAHGGASMTQQSLWAAAPPVAVTAGASAHIPKLKYSSSAPGSRHHHQQQPSSSNSGSKSTIARYSGVRGRRLRLRPYYLSATGPSSLDSPGRKAPLKEGAGRGAKLGYSYPYNSQHQRQRSSSLARFYRLSASSYVLARARLLARRRQQQQRGQGGRSRHKTLKRGQGAAGGVKRILRVKRKKMQHQGLFHQTQSMSSDGSGTVLTQLYRRSRIGLSLVRKQATLHVVKPKVVTAEEEEEEAAVMAAAKKPLKKRRLERAQAVVEQALGHSRNRTLKRKLKQQEYCLFFNRFGKCNKADTTCPYLHDPDKVAVCRKFLRGKCDGDGCLLSHVVSRDKMPVCEFFLRGSCNNDSCPYSHVKVNSKAGVCPDFLKGYCPAGAACKLKHVEQLQQAPPSTLTASGRSAKRTTTDLAAALASDDVSAVAKRPRVQLPTSSDSASMMTAPPTAIPATAHRGAGRSHSSSFVWSGGGYGSGSMSQEEEEDNNDEEEEAKVEAQIKELFSVYPKVITAMLLGLRPAPPPPWPTTTFRGGGAATSNRSRAFMTAPPRPMLTPVPKSTSGSSSNRNMVSSQQQTQQEVPAVGKSEEAGRSARDDEDEDEDIVPRVLKGTSMAGPR